MAYSPVAWERLGALRNLSTLPSVRSCRLWLLPTAATVRVGVDGVVSGLQTCGSPWACPLCSARIATHRAELVEAASATVRAQGGAAYGAVLTLRHDRSHTLAELLSAVQLGWRDVWAGRARETAAARFGVVAAVRCTEVAWSDRTGWHPHIHTIVWTEQPLSEELRAELSAWIADRYRASVPYDASWSGNGALEELRDIGATAAYVTKGIAGSALDTTGGPNKGSHPLHLLDAARLGDSAARELWNEYERATKGRRAIGWLWRSRLELSAEDDPDPEELEDETPWLEVPDTTWRALARARQQARLIALVVLCREHGWLLERLQDAMLGGAGLAIAFVSDYWIDAGVDSPRGPP